MANDYNILADYIVSRYIERIAGDDIEETFVDESPADRVMVGMKRITFNIPKSSSSVHAILTCDLVFR